jgi:hypothetical protein
MVELRTMLLPAAVGANLWLVAVLLPLVLERSWVVMPGRGLAALFAMALLPPAALYLGIRRRSLMALFVAFPFTCALPELLLGGRAARVGIVGSAPLPLTAAVLVAYLLAAAHALGRTEAPPDAAQSQPLTTSPTPRRWTRRLRLYRTQVALSALFPVALLFWLLGWPGTRDAFEGSFAAHTDDALAASAAGVGLLWIALYRFYFLGPLEGHLHHDREVRIQLEIARRQARRGRPRPASTSRWCARSWRWRQSCGRGRNEARRAERAESPPSGQVLDELA